MSTEDDPFADIAAPADNVVRIRDEPPGDWLAAHAPYGDVEEERQPLALIDPVIWQDDEPPHRRWVIDGLIPHGQATLLTGAGSAGKSLVAQLMCTCVGAGLPWLGVETEQAVTIYISCEDDKDELWRRQKAICEGLGISLASLSGKVYVLSLAGELDNELATFDERGRLSVCGRFRDIQDACARVGARFVVLDNTGHFFAGNENDRHQVAGFVNLNNGLANLIDGAVVLIGHPNKAGGEYSGSTAWENQVRSRLFMETPLDANGVPSDPDMRVLRRGKSNYAQKGHEIRFMWFKWTFVLPDELPANARDNSAASALAFKENEAFLECLAVCASKQRAVSHQRGINHCASIFARMPHARGMSMVAFEAAMERLLTLGKIELNQPLWRGENRHWKYGIKAVPDRKNAGSEQNREES